MPEESKNIVAKPAVKKSLYEAGAYVALIEPYKGKEKFTLCLVSKNCDDFISCFIAI